MPGMEPRAVDFSIIFRFDFGLDFGLVLGPFWARLGRLLGPFWEAKSGQVGSKIHLEVIFVQKSQCSKNSGKHKARATFLTPRWAQDGLKTGPRRVQERSKSDAFFVLIFDSFGGRLGLDLGPIWGSKIVPKSLGRLTLDALDFDLMIRWSQDGRQVRPKRVQEPPRAVQDLPKTLPRGPKTSQERPETPPRPSKEGPRAPKSGLSNP